MENPRPEKNNNRVNYIKKGDYHYFYDQSPLAERGGFEPPEVLPSTVFETATINRSAISPVPPPGTSSD
jgi:hypothetical protein